ncbi:hypothetical protein DP42_5602 [Burkholderia pseudomallei]|nr:hypothetical protein DP42_5602 [Burkholderia pseudomallei]
MRERARLHRVIAHASAAGCRRRYFVIRIAWPRRAPPASESPRRAAHGSLCGAPQAAEVHHGPARRVGADLRGTAPPRTSRRAGKRCIRARHKIFVDKPTKDDETHRHGYAHAHRRSCCPPASERPLWRITGGTRALVIRNIGCQRGPRR